MTHVPKISTKIPAETLFETVKTGVVLPIAIENWPGHGQKSVGGENFPQTELCLAHDGDNLFLHFSVRDDDVQALYGIDQEPVWFDSCVELFLSPMTPNNTGTLLPGEPQGYYNFEFNAVGTVLAFFGKGRDGRVPQKPEILASIKRHSSLGRMPFKLREGRIDWELDIKIPKTAFAFHSLPTLDGQVFLANAYKCGDHLPHPHYLSWKKIPTPKPDFHRPEFFDRLRMETGIHD